jgi:4a-hydroxytetrahydrobiopterin dehydratase
MTVPEYTPAEGAKAMSETKRATAGAGDAADAGLAARHCKPLAKGTPALAAERVTALLKQVPGWEQRGGEIARTYAFKNYYETMAFVNAAAWVSHREDHHPDLEVGYNKCRVRYSTHSVGGLSENDFICAAKLDALFSI